MSNHKTTSHNLEEFILNSSLSQEEYKPLLDYYSKLIISKGKQLRKTSDKLVVDAYFSKKPFLDSVISVKFNVISRLRDDAVLQYAYLGLAQKGRGRPKKFAGRLDPKNLSKEHFTTFRFAKIYFSTYIQMACADILIYYKTRF